MIESTTQKRSRTLQKKTKQREVNQDGAKYIRDPQRNLGSNENNEFSNTLNEKRKSERYLSSHGGLDSGKQTSNTASKAASGAATDQFQSLNYKTPYQTMSNMAGNSKNQHNAGDIQNIAVVGHRNLISNQLQFRQNQISNTQGPSGNTTKQAQYVVPSTAYSDHLASAASPVKQGHFPQSSNYQAQQLGSNGKEQSAFYPNLNNHRRAINNLMGEKQKFGGSNNQNLNSQQSAQGPSSLSIHRGNTPSLTQYQIPNQGHVYQTYHLGSGNASAGQRGYSQTSHPHVQLLDVDTIVKQMKQQQQQQQQQIQGLSSTQASQAQKTNQVKFGQSNPNGMQISGFSDYTNNSNKTQGPQGQQINFLSPAQSFNATSQNFSGSAKANFKGMVSNTNRIGTAGNSVVSSNGHPSILHRSLSNKQSQKQIQPFKNANSNHIDTELTSNDNMQIYVNQFQRPIEHQSEKKDLNSEPNPLVQYTVKPNQAQAPNLSMQTNQKANKLLSYNPKIQGIYDNQRVPGTDPLVKVKTQGFSPNVHQKISTVRNNQGQLLDDFGTNGHMIEQTSPVSIQKGPLALKTNEIGHKTQKAYDNLVVTQSLSNHTMPGGDPLSLMQSFSRDAGNMKWNTDQKIQIQIENKQDGSPSQRTIYIKKSQANLGSNPQFKVHGTESHPQSPVMPQNYIRVPRQNNLLEEHTDGVHNHLALQKNSQSADYQNLSQQKDRFNNYGHYIDSNGNSSKKSGSQTANSTNDRNKEYQKYLMQYINSQNQNQQQDSEGRLLNSNPNNILQMQNILHHQAQQPQDAMGPQNIFNRNMQKLGNDGPGGMILAPGTGSPSQPRSKSSAPQKKQQYGTQDQSGFQVANSSPLGDKRPIFINHGDINININFNNSGSAQEQQDHMNNLKNLSREELSQLIYQNMLLQHQQQAFQNQDRKSQVSINEQLENFAVGLSNQNESAGQINPSSGLDIKHKQRLNLAKNFQPSPKTGKSPKGQKRRLGTSDTEKIEGRNGQQQSHGLLADQGLNHSRPLDPFDRNSQNQHIGKHLKQNKQSKSSVQPSLQPSQTYMLDHQHPMVSNQPQKLSTSMSKQQLKKQVVQYYWQHLIQSYGIEAKVKLDVKGKTINGNPNPSAPHQQVPFMVQGLAGKSGNQPLGYHLGHSSSKKNIAISQQKEQLMQQQAQILSGIMQANHKIPIQNLQQELMQHPPNCQCFYHQNESLRKQLNFNEVQQNLQQMKCRVHGKTSKSQNHGGKVDFVPHQSSQQCTCHLGQSTQGGRQEQLINQRDQLLNEIYKNVSYNWQQIPISQGGSNLWQGNAGQYYNQYDMYDERKQNTGMMSQHYPQYWQSPDYATHQAQPIGGTVHLFDQFGQHSHLCKCFKHQNHKEGGSKLMMDPYQRLNYIQQVCMQERSAAQAHSQAVQSKTPSNATSNNQQNPKTKRKLAVPLTRMELINNFIKKLNQLILITLKATDSINPLALGQIKKLGQEIGIKWHTYLDAKFIKSKDFVTFLKSKIYVLLNNMLMRNNMTLFDQVQHMCDQNEKLNHKKENNSSKKDRERGVEREASGPEKIVVGEVLKQSWLNQVQIFNLLKFKNQGFKFWVEYPTSYGNNFIVVKNVTKRRTWLTWVDYDPYEERDEKATQIYQQTENNSNQAQNIKAIEESPSPAKRGQSQHSKKKERQKQIEEELEESEDEKNQNPYGPIYPNIIYTQVRRLKIVKDLMPHQIYNHIDGINQIATKCQLHMNMKDYAINVTGESPWNIMPQTFIIELQEKMNSKYVLEHEQFKEFLTVHTKDSWWIIKPGEDANRGNGIKVFNNLQKIKEHITFEFNSGAKQYKTCIIQKYIENPYLIHRRKFDIRVFALLTYVANFEKNEGTLRGWFYEEGYIRTSSKEFGLSAGDNLFVHLTNDAVQKNSCDYGKYEAGNKISYSDFDKMLIKDKDVSFYQKLLPQIKKRTGDVFKAAGKKLIGEVRSDYNGFEWLGLDFMIDDDMKLDLIEVNTNPCLETQSCILLQRLIPQMIDQSLKIAVDPFFGANEHQYLMNQEFVATEVKYSMVYEEIIEGLKSTPTWDMNTAYYQPPKRQTEQQEDENDTAQIKMNCGLEESIENSTHEEK